MLVCKRWSRLADSPDLLRVLDFTIPGAWLPQVALLHPSAETCAWYVLV